MQTLPPTRRGKGAECTSSSNERSLRWLSPARAWSTSDSMSASAMAQKPRGITKAKGHSGVGSQAVTWPRGRWSTLACPASPGHPDCPSLRAFGPSGCVCLYIYIFFKLLQIFLCYSQSSCRWAQSPLLATPPPTGGINDLQREGNDSDVGLHQGPAGGIIVISIVLRNTHCATEPLKICSYFVAPVSFTNGTLWGEWRVVGARIPCHINTYVSGAINHCLRASLACFFTLRLPATLLLFAD